MPNENWLAYLSAIAGFVGAVSGIGGLVLAILAFRRTGQLKALDLRLELRRCERSLRSSADDVSQLLETAKASHTRLGAARGSYRSGAMKAWLAEWENDVAQASSLKEQVVALGSTSNTKSQVKLEARLNVVQDLQHRLAKVSEKYRGALSKDDIGREQLHADQRAVIQARIEGKS